tara:strand:- start:314 stop:472 length:159 start_codon:yes stop_codon:yes gene_type:complete
LLIALLSGLPQCLDEERITTTLVVMMEAEALGCLPQCLDEERITTKLGRAVS